MTPFPLALQTAYRDLLDRHLRRPVPEVEGSVLLSRNHDNAYWVVRRRIGDSVVEERIGPDSQETRQRAADLKQQNEALQAWGKETGLLVAQLRAARMPVPTVGTGKLLNALARAKLFSSGAVLAGTHAFGLYQLELGTRLDGALAMTEDVDLAADRAVRLITDTPASMTSPLAGLGLRPVAGPMQDRTARWETPDHVVLDVLTPLGRTKDPVTLHKGLGIWAQALPFLEFCLKDPIEAVVLYREGILVRIPTPERFAIHKLIVAAARSGTYRAKSEKDLHQAAALIEVLAEARPYELAAAYEEAMAMGPKWRAALAASINRRPAVAALLAPGTG